jgi:deoxyribonuclease-4
MRLLGAHMSTAGGVSKAIERGNSLGCTAIQIFVKNNNQWSNPPLDQAEVERFLSLRKETEMFVFAHAGYLINLCSANPANREKSHASMLEELEKSEQLQLPFVVLHPGSHGGLGEEAGIKTVASSLNSLFMTTKGYKVKILLENTAGQGSALGYKFDHFKQILDLIDEPERLGFCFDTCHGFAAGYDLKSTEGYDNTWLELKKAVGLKKLMAFHLNDSKKPLGSKVDRHEHIGRGELGEQAFAHLLNDSRFKNLPMVIETPKDPDLKLDRLNLQLLHSLIK